MEKTTIPIKTRIIAWIMTVIGGIGGGIGLIMLILYFDCAGIWCIYFIWGIIGFILGLFYFIPGFFLLKRKKWAWKVSIGILSFGALCSLGFVIYYILQSFKIGKLDIADIAGGIFTFLPPIWVPLILILLDKKNYWKIAS